MNFDICFCFYTWEVTFHIGNMLNVLEEKSEEESWVDKQAWLTTARRPSQEHGIYGTAARVHSNTPVNFKL